MKSLSFRRIELTVLLLCLAMLQACVLLQPSVDQAYQDSMTSLSQTRTQAAQAVQQGKVSKTEGQQILQQTDQARVFLNEASKVRKTDEKTARARIDDANKIIKPIQQRLKSLP